MQYENEGEIVEANAAALDGEERVFSSVTG